MDRRSFLNKTSLAAGMLPFTPGATRGLQPELIKPRAVSKGATISLITPASPITRSAFEKTLENISLLGFKAKYSPNVRVRSGFLSGTDQQRVEDIHAAFEDAESEAVLCFRGGYGTGRLLPDVNYDLVRANPKPLIGFSDVTALLSAIYKYSGLVCFHGPVGASDFPDFTTDLLLDTLVKGKKIKVRNDEENALFPGTATGRLIGGNLSILCSLIGTPHDVDYSGHILFLEEVGEATYRIDRMLTQMLNSGKFNGVKGIALGYFTGCDTKTDDPSYEYSLSLDEVFSDRLGKLGIPIAKGFPFGHESHNATIPIGVEAELDADAGLLKLLDSPVA